MNALATLVRREYWEHRGLWIAPLIVSLVLILGTLLSPTVGGHVQINGQELSFISSMTEEKRITMFGLIVGGLMIPQMMVMLVVLFFYLSDALYGERKDRSILFWKSLPVSDASTVLSKLLVALATTPLIVFFTSLLTGLLCYAILAMKFNGTPFAGLASFNGFMLLRMAITTFADLLIGSLWYAPVAAFVLLVSGWARRSVFLWVVLPPLVLGITEKWLLNSSRFAAFLEYRLFGLFSMMGVGEKREVAVGATLPTDKLDHLGESLVKFDLSHVLLNVDLWLGVLAAAAMVLIAIRVRRYRDDTSG